MSLSTHSFALSILSEIAEFGCKVTNFSPIYQIFRPQSFLKAPQIFPKPPEIDRSQAPFVAIGIVVAIGDDNMIQEIELHELAGILELARDVVVLRARIEVARRVVVA